jgi:hypothetical protein
MFSQKSRYLKTEQYPVRDRRGRIVNVVAVPDAPDQSLLGFHQLMEGQRIDHLAAKYTLDDAGFWRIAEANDAMLPETLSERPEIAIPNK